MWTYTKNKQIKQDEGGLVPFLLCTWTKDNIPCLVIGKVSYEFLTNLKKSLPPSDEEC